MSTNMSLFVWTVKYFSTSVMQSMNSIIVHANDTINILNLQLFTDSATESRLSEVFW